MPHLADILSSDYIAKLSAVSSVVSFWKVPCLDGLIYAETYIRVSAYCNWIYFFSLTYMIVQHFLSGLYKLYNVCDTMLLLHLSGHSNCYISFWDSVHLHFAKYRSQYLSCPSHRLSFCGTSMKLWFTSHIWSLQFLYKFIVLILLLNIYFFM